MNHVPAQIHNLQATIAALEAQRPILGDAVVQVALKPLRDQLAALTASPDERKYVTVLFWISAYLYAVKHMGERGVAIGSDINGAAALPGPRFGTFAAYGAHGDRHRRLLRRAQIDGQVNGARYATPVRDYRWYRFARNSFSH